MHRIEALIPGWSVERFTDLERPAWMGLRREDVTASELGCLFGDVRYLTPLGLYHRKLQGEDPFQNAAMKRGKVMEPAAAKLVCMDLPCLQVESHDGSYLRLRTADPLIRIGATKDYQARAHMDELGPALARLGVRAPDEWQGDVSLALELKTVAEGAYHAHWADGPPRQYVLQASTQAMLGGDDGAILAAMVISPSLTLRLVVYTIRRNFDAELAIVDKVRSFWEAYVQKRLPEAQGADNKILGELYPAQPGQTVNLTLEPGWTALSERRLKDKELIAVLTKQVESAEAKLKDRMQTATEAILPGYIITWRQNAKARPLIWKRRNE